VSLAGIAKGSGMIAPNMATMLVFTVTDCAITAPSLAAALREAALGSFNRISVDEHTSPSDTVLTLASGLAGNPRITARRGRDYRAFVAALTELCRDLAYQIVRDGEGATRVFRVRVRSARDAADADRIGRAIVNSPLVKTAVHGADPNWGRIVTAAGYSGAAVRPERMRLSIGDVAVFARGTPVRVTATRRLARLMREKEVTFTLDVGLGTASVEWLGCDLSRAYVAIHAGYTTPCAPSGSPACEQLRAGALLANGRRERRRRPERAGRRREAIIQMVSSPRCPSSRTSKPTSTRWRLAWSERLSIA